VSEATETEIHLAPERAAEMLEAGAEAIDVRRDYEWEAGRIAGARHIEVNDLTSSADSIPRDRPVIFYCRSGNRSGMAVEAFRQAGFEAFNIDGGLTAWAAAGLPVDPPDGEVAPPRPT
jgi:rhodanese-related sulfurtransferase